MASYSPGGPGEKIPVAVLGATGSVGQRFVSLLAEHPWFEIAALTASERSAGKRYADAVRWMQSSPIPRGAANRLLQGPESRPKLPLVFSALDASVAFDIEAEVARAGSLVVSNAKSHRMSRDVPLIVPEVNSEHLELASKCRFAPGAILTNPNCSTIGLVLALKPLRDRFGVRRANVVTMQAVSGAGLPGVSSYEILDNVVPYIPEEEDKIERESRKIFGVLLEGEIVEAEMAVSAHCNRVPVVDGHVLAVSVELERSASVGEIRGAWETFASTPTSRLPTAPEKPIHYLAGSSVPQPRLHRDIDGGMAVSIGRLRPCPVLDFKFIAVSHNTVRGAAGGALLLAELAVSRGLLTATRALSKTAG